ncbi:SCO family protein [Alphaproteobacteria bacterium GH1-50]|uniref:SCO family protein n=1 Tax=Kangsaoukella pontilimi TaxID=2691042 RepID=A0A7C9ISR8_9RHOB|nr:SCO family protein [Kangsaoukella pontilimi]MXQ08225.1 SCO family protein [Kangsaoukella pontilimi]
MTKFAASASALAIVALIGATAAYTYLRPLPDCGGNSVAGGSAAIGGPFELLNGAGETVTEADIIDGPTLVYFGYTFCPDVCPFDVARNVLAVDLLDEMGHDVTPVFITIDPARDTVEIMDQYARDMHPKMIALTGSDEQVRAAAQEYRVYYAKGSGEGDFYLMDHSTFTYLMFPETGLATYFGRTATPEEMAGEIACHIGNA